MYSHHAWMSIYLLVYWIGQTINMNDENNRTGLLGTGGEGELTGKVTWWKCVYLIMWEFSRWLANISKLWDISIIIIMEGVPSQGSERGHGRGSNIKLGSSSGRRIKIDSRIKLPFWDWLGSIRHPFMGYVMKSSWLYAPLLYIEYFPLTDRGNWILCGFDKDLLIPVSTLTDSWT